MLLLLQLVQCRPPLLVCYQSAAHLREIVVLRSGLAGHQGGEGAGTTAASWGGGRLDFGVAGVDVVQAVGGKGRLLLKPGSGDVDATDAAPEEGKGLRPVEGKIQQVSRIYL